MSIKLITDSASDIPASLEKELDINVLSFPIAVDGKSYMDRVDFDNETFYKMQIEAEKIPTHAQITQIRFVEAFEEAVAEGYDEIICVIINAKGSGTFLAAQMAKNEFDEAHKDDGYRVTVLDSTTYTMVYGYAVVEAAKMAKKGVSYDEIVAFIQDWCKTAEVYFAPYSLEFVKKSGRVSCAAAFAGELLGLRPIFTFIDGEAKTIAKVRGDKNVIPKLVEIAKERRIPQTPYFTLRGSLPDRADELDGLMEKAMGQESYGSFYIGATISINAGPNLVAIVVKGDGTRTL